MAAYYHAAQYAGLDQGGAETCDECEHHYPECLWTHEPNKGGSYGTKLVHQVNGNEDILIMEKILLKID
jgi:hypothetical protein